MEKPIFNNEPERGSVFRSIAAIGSAPEVAGAFCREEGAQELKRRNMSPQTIRIEVWRINNQTMEEELVHSSGDLKGVYYAKVWQKRRVISLDKPQNTNQTREANQQRQCF